jgi:hypothetical protein
MKLLKRFFRWLLNKNELEAIVAHLTETNRLLTEIYAIEAKINLIEPIQPIKPIINKIRNQWS